MSLETGFWLLAGAAFLYVGVRTFWHPIRWGVRLAVNLTLGMLALYAWNHWVTGPHWTVAINPYTAGAIGLLGASGFVLVLAMRFMLRP